MSEPRFATWEEFREVVRASDTYQGLPERRPTEFDGVVVVECAQAPATTYQRHRSGVAEQVTSRMYHEEDLTQTHCRQCGGPLLLHQWGAVGGTMSRREYEDACRVAWEHNFWEKP